jgi:hypothetical protein
MGTLKWCSQRGQGPSSTRQDLTSECAYIDFKRFGTSHGDNCEQVMNTAINSPATEVCRRCFRFDNLSDVLKDLTDVVEAAGLIDGLIQCCAHPKSPSWSKWSSDYVIGDDNLAMTLACRSALTALLSKGDPIPTTTLLAGVNLADRRAIWSEGHTYGGYNGQDVETSWCTGLIEMKIVRCLAQDLHTTAAVVSEP